MAAAEVVDPNRLSYDRGPSAPSLLESTIGANLAATAARYGHREALVDMVARRRFNYSELLTDVHRLATGLVRAGIGPGDRVGIWAPNRWEWVLVQYATAEIGAILVTINPAYRVREVEYALRQSGVAMVIAVASFKDADYAAMLAEVGPRCPDLADVILLESDRWDALAGAEPDLPALQQTAARLDGSDPVNIQYTSGTTAYPKGVTLSHRNILNNGYLVGELLGYTAQDRICIPVPFYHCFGMVMGNLAATSHGAAMVIPAPGFDPAATLRAVQDERCTSLYGVPTMFIAELGLPDFTDYELGSLRTGIMAGAACPVEVMRKVISRMHMPGVSICYGMTETSPVSTQTRADDSVDRRVGTVGRVGPHLEIKVVDPATGETVPRGVVGEFCTRGYSVMAGYWNDPQKTAEVIDADGWMHTGDLAEMDPSGYVRIAGRIKDLVVRGRREHLAAGDRGTPPHASRYCRRSRHRGARRQIRRRAHGGGQAEKRRAGTDHRAAARVLHGPHRAIQDPAVPVDRRRVPDDRHRQSTQSGDATTGARIPPRPTVRSLDAPRGQWYSHLS